MINIKDELLKLQDEKYKEFNSNLCPDNNRKMIGIRVPILRKFSKELLKNYSLDDIINSIDTEYFEEVMVRGFCIAYTKMELEDKCKYIDSFVPLIDSWAITDSFVPTLMVQKKDLEFIWEYIKKYLKSNKEFYIRFAVIMMLDYFIIDEYVNEVIEILNNISYKGYYVKMGVAWCLCEIGIKYYDKFICYMKSNDNKLDKFTYNKTIQKMIESYRVTNEHKNELRNLKKLKK